MKKIICMLISVCMAMSFVPTFALAATEGTTFVDGYFKYKVNADTSTVTLTAIDDTTIAGAVTVPSTVTDGTSTYTVTQLSTAFDTRNNPSAVNIKSLVLPDTITKFTTGATFYGCTNLSSIHLPANLTGDTTAGQLTKTFYFCAYLSNVVLPKGITKCYGTFNNGCGTRTVTITGKSEVDFYAGSGTKEARAWADGTPGITINYPYDGVKPKRTSATDSFTATLKTYGNPTFTSGNFTYSIISGTSNVTLTSIAVTKLTGEVTVPSTVSDGVNTYTVTQLGDAFKNQGTKTEEMTSLVLPDTITKFTGTGTFYGCKFESIHLPANLEGDGNASYSNCLYNTFQYCTLLEEVELPEKIVRCYGTFRNSDVKTVTITGKKAVDFYGGSGTSDARAWTDGTKGITIYYPADGTVPSRYEGSFTATPVAVGQQIAVSEFEVGDFKYKVVEGTKNVSVLGFSTSSNKSGEKILPETVTYANVTYTVTSVGYAAFANNTGLTSFIMADTVTNVGANIFYGCKNLSYVHLSDNLANASSSNQLVGAFYGCTALKNVTIPGGIRTLSKTFINSGIENVVLKAKFTEIPGKDYVPFSNLETVNVYYASDATIGGTSAASIKNTFVYDGFIAYKQKEDGTFKAISILPGYTLSGNVIIPSAIGALKINEIGDEAFADADGITSITVPDSVVTIGKGAFANCDNLENVVLSENIVGELKQTFANCVKLTYITIPQGVSILDGTFAGCSSLSGVRFAQSVTTLTNKAFYGCSALTKLAVPNTVLQITDGENASGTVFPNGITLIVQDESSALEYAIANNIDYVVKPVVEYLVNNGNAEVTKTYFRIIGEYTIPESVSINGSTYNVTSIASGAFSEQDALTVLAIPDSMSDIAEDAFDGCENVDFAVRVNSDTSAYAVIKSALVNYIVDDVKTGLAYKKYTSSDGLEIYSSANNTQISGEVVIDAFDGLSVVSIGDSALKGQSGITSVTMSDTITSIGNSAFADCDSLVKTTLSKNVAGTLDSTFKGCISLEKVDIPAGVTALKNTYNGCISLTRVIIPDTLVAIYENSFANCTGLETVVIPETVTTFDRMIGFKDESQTEAEYVETNTSKKWVDNPFKGATNENLAICGVRGSVAEEFAYSSGIKFIDITKEDYTLEYSDISGETIKLSVRDIYGKGNATVIGALYDNEGKMLECQPIPIEFNSEACKTVFTENIKLADYSENTTLKFMIWNSLGMLSPIKDVETAKTPEPIKILVLGNSISNHGTSSASGWFAPDSQGMAATSIDKDFVHVVLNKAKEINPNVEVNIVTAWSLEAQFDKWETLIASEYQDAVNYDADIIIAQFGENVKNNENEGSLGGSFDNENEFTSTIFENIVKSFIKEGKDVPVIAITSMMSNKAVVLEAKQKACEDNGWACINLYNDSNFKESKNSAYYLTPNQVEEGLSLGTFKADVPIASGVYVHPGNNGMRAMAYSIWRYLDPIIEEMTYNN